MSKKCRHTHITVKGCDQCLIADLEAENKELVKAARWRPIESAPKDRTEVLLLNTRKGHAASGYWLAVAFDGIGAWIWPFIHLEPDMWLPLQLPKESSSDE